MSWGPPNRRHSSGKGAPNLLVSLPNRPLPQGRGTTRIGQQPFSFEGVYQGTCSRLGVRSEGLRPHPEGSISQQSEAGKAPSYLGHNNCLYPEDDNGITTFPDSEAENVDSIYTMLSTTRAVSLQISYAYMDENDGGEGNNQTNQRLDNLEAAINAISATLQQLLAMQNATTIP